MADAVDEVAVEYIIVQSKEIDILNADRKDVACIAHVDFLKREDCKYNFIITGHLVLDVSSGEMSTVYDRLFSRGKKFGINFGGKVIWWFLDFEKVEDVEHGHINFAVDDWETQVKVSIEGAKRTIEKL